jgi:hypothetical protein
MKTQVLKLVSVVVVLMFATTLEPSSFKEVILAAINVIA